MLEIHFGFTGTRLGMTSHQRSAVRLAMQHVRTNHPKNEYWLHHGDCVGADEQAWEIAKGAGFKTWGHPPNVLTYRANTENDKSSEPKTYKTRNKDIVRASLCVVVAPLTADFRNRNSGTTMTYNIAKRLDRDVVVCYPDGSMEHEGEVWL